MYQPLILIAFDPPGSPLIRCNIGQERRSKVVVHISQFHPSSWLVLHKNYYYKRYKVKEKNKDKRMNIYMALILFNLRSYK